MCDCKERCTILKDQNKFISELTHDMLELYEKSLHLIESCGAANTEYNFRLKLAKLAEEEHEKKIKRIKQEYSIFNKQPNRKEVDGG